ncbi:MAG: hypothetical protein EYC62_07300 [Alphaproteobacteria bacterium]|nr:MAG: hypothetical protein EYC62_07300 [Alphaproteobacteria bacterium]
MKNKFYKVISDAAAMQTGQVVAMNPAVPGYSAQVAAVTFVQQVNTGDHTVPVGMVELDSADSPMGTVLSPQAIEALVLAAMTRAA